MEGKDVMKPAHSRRRLSAAWLSLVLTVVCATGAWAADLPTQGDSLSDISFTAPKQAGDREALGLPGASPFTLSDIDAGLIMIEVIGVYCPICHDQAPTLRTLYSALTRDAALSKQVRLFALASGATDMEIAFVRKEHRAEYPIVPDVDYAVHKQLGEPGTPFTILARPDGTVLYTHMGRIEDADAFLDTIRSFVKE